MSELLPWAGLVAALITFLWLDLHFFARGRQPSFRESVVWSIGWLVLGLAVTLVVLVLDSPERAIEYTTVYLIERSLSLDNLFVFLLLFAYFAVPQELRARLLFFGIAFALVLRGLAILVGVALIEQFEWVLYILGALLILLAWRIFKGVDDDMDPSKNLVVRGVRRIFPVTEGYEGNKWFTRISDKVHATPLFLCLAAIVAADIAFAVDSIPAAFGITRDELIIWMGNIFALLGLRALFVLVEGLIRRFRYLDETIAIVLALVGVKLIIEHWVHIGPVASLLMVLVAFAVGITASLIADKRDPEGAEARKAEQAESSPGAAGEGGYSTSGSGSGSASSSGPSS
jgi:tellurite resistance protein TerC